SKCTFNFKLFSSYRFSVISVTNDHITQFCFKIHDVCCQTKYSHDLTCNRDINTIFTWYTAAWSAKTYNYLTQCTVVHVNYSLPRNTTRVKIQFVTLVNVIVNERGKSVVGCCDSMQVTVEVKVDFLHRQYLCLATTGSSTFNTHNRT